ncbi:MAG: tetratricopeptide repeat protein [Okeania sp. SIO2H7]|nr:tetratricopeptide repeat protein [Okeania sp. SIO2H7]
MQLTEKEYMEARKRRSQRLRKIMAFVGVCSFGGTALFSIANLYKSGLEEPQQVETAPVISAEERLEQRARGYEAVLAREPENRNALEELVKVRLQMGDREGAIAPLEKLVELYPEREDYKVVLEQTRSQKGQ